jgi:hypothetical protein
VHLASVTVSGDLGTIDAFDSLHPEMGLGKLVLGSFAALGQDGRDFVPGGVPNLAGLGGHVGSIVIRGDLGPSTGRTALDLNGANSISVGGDLHNLDLLASGNISSIRIGGSMSDATLQESGAVGTLTIGHALEGSTIYVANDSFLATTQAKSVALKSLTVGGSVTDSLIRAGFELRLSPGSAEFVNPDVSIGSVLVKGNWVRSSLAAGVATDDSLLGNADDFLGSPSTGPNTGVVGGSQAIVASIASITIRGQIVGTNPPGGTDHFGFEAQQIRSFTLGTTRFPRLPGMDGPVEVGYSGDVTVREVSG